MKKHYTILSIICTLCLTNTHNAYSQAIQQGNMTFDAYYGFPNLWTSILKGVLANQGGISGVSASGIGPVGGKFEYMVSEKVGLGAEANFASTTLNYTEMDTIYNPSTSLWESKPNNYKTTYNRTRIMARMNIHFGSSENFDGFFGIGAGYKTTSLKTVSSDPSTASSADLDRVNLVPVAFRIAIGGRYFFSENLGANFELGFFGGPILSAGLSLKL